MSLPINQLSLGGHPVIGFGSAALVAPAVAAVSPWPMVLASSVVSAAAGWAIDEVARRTFRKSKRR
jgi:hypothetical protein